MSTWHENLRNGELEAGFVKAYAWVALWVVSSAWTVAIRGISLELIPSDSLGVVGAELVAASSTTLLMFGVLGIIASRFWAMSGAEPAPAFGSARHTSRR